MIEISFHQVRKSFQGASGRVDVLRNMDLIVRPGEFLCVVGPSGCGKSTLLNLAAGLDLPDSGDVMLGGQRVVGPQAACGLIFQDPPLFPWLSVLDNVGFALQMQGLGAAQRRERARALLVDVGLEPFSRSWPHELSGGMKQRVALAAALAKDPDVLLLDEPFAALDAQTRDDLHESLESLWLASRKTVIFVTHNVREAVRLGDRVALFSPQTGQMAKVYPVNLPRGRHLEDVSLVQIAAEIRVELSHRLRPNPVLEASHVRA